jgi:mannose/fructose/N-acetylgalactosamine-specific phosphotransferase system component IIB
MTNSKESAKNTSQKQPEKDVFLTVLYAPDRESFARLLREEVLDVGPMHTRPDAKEIEVHLYADEEQIEKLKKDGWKLSVRENLSEVGRKRQSEVGIGDRFKGGEIPPKGLGKKVKTEDE